LPSKAYKFAPLTHCSAIWATVVSYRIVIFCVFPHGCIMSSSVVMVAGICDLTCHRGGCEYLWVSRLGLLETNRCHGFKIILVVLECTNCSMHATVGVH